MMRLSQVAHARAGDKGRSNTLSIFPYDARDFEALAATVTTKALRAHLGDRVRGETIRWELPRLCALQFFLDDMARGDVTLATELDAHGKSLSGIVLDLEVPNDWHWHGRRNQPITTSGLEIPTEILATELPLIITAAGAGLIPSSFSHLANLGWPLLHINYLAGEGPFEIKAVAHIIAEQLRTRVAPTVLAGHSLGGALFLMVAGIAPESVDAALIADTGLSTACHADPSLAKRIATNWNRESAEEFLGTCFAVPPEGEDWDRLLDFALTLDTEAFSTATASLRAIDITEYAEAITAPLTVVHGLHDQRRNLGHARGIRDTVAGSHLHLLDCGHTPMLECPHEHAGLMRELLTRANIDFDN